MSDHLPSDMSYEVTRNLVYGIMDQEGGDGNRYIHDFTCQEIRFQVVAARVIPKQCLLMVLLMEGPTAPDTPCRTMHWKLGVKLNEERFPRWLAEGRKCVRDLPAGWSIQDGCRWPLSDINPPIDGSITIVVEYGDTGFHHVVGEMTVEEEPMDLNCINRIETFYPPGEESDVTIRVKDETFSAHREVLVSHSPVLAAMFSSGMEESRTGTLSMDDCEPGEFRILLFYIYSGRVSNLNHDNVMGTYYLADKYGMTGLKKACFDFIVANFSVGRICDAFRIAIIHSDEELLKRATFFFAQNAIEILPLRQWKRFSLEFPAESSEIYRKTVWIMQERADWQRVMNDQNFFKGMTFGMDISKS